MHEASVPRSLVDSYRRFFFFLTVHELLSSSGCMITGYGSGGGGGIMDQAAQGSWGGEGGDKN